MLILFSQFRTQQIVTFTTFYVTLDIALIKISCGDYLGIVGIDIIFDHFSDKITKKVGDVEIRGSLPFTKVLLVRVRTSYDS